MFTEDDCTGFTRCNLQKSLCGEHSPPLKSKCKQRANGIYNKVVMGKTTLHLCYRNLNGSKQCTLKISKEVHSVSCPKINKVIIVEVYTVYNLQGILRKYLQYLIVLQQQTNFVWLLQNISLNLRIAILSCYKKSFFSGGSVPKANVLFCFLFSKLDLGQIPTLNCAYWALLHSQRAPEVQCQVQSSSWLQNELLL